MDRFQQERSLLRPLPALAFDTDEVVSAVVNSHARVHFDGNRYSVPADLARKTVMVRANATQLRVLFQGAEVARHTRCYDRGQVICLSDHQLDALRSVVACEPATSRRPSMRWVSQARQFHLELCRRPVKTTVHLRRLMNLVRLYGRAR